MLTLSERLREKGLKITPQRMAIYSMLVNTTAHPTAEAVWEDIKRDYPAVSFNTVYTTLNTFEQAGLIQKLFIGAVAHFDANTGPHIHLHCNQCGKVEDHHTAVGVDLKDVGHKVVEQTGFAVGRLELNLYGLCTECIKAR